MAKVAIAQRNRQLDALTARLNSGVLRIYSGTKPATADTVLAGNTLLATLTFGATAFAGATGATATANAIVQDSSAAANGTATFARLYETGGTVAVLDVTVGTSGTELIMSSVTVTTGLVVQISSLVLVQPDGTGI